MTDHPTLVISATLAMAAAVVYALVGWSLAQRRVGPDARLAAHMFVVWWLALAASSLLGGLRSTLGALHLATLPVVTTLTTINLLAVCVALWGLLYYLLYLFTGRRGLIKPLSVFYAAYYAFLVFYVTSSRPTSVALETWQVRLVYANPLEGPVFALALVLLIIPQILGALAYGTLYYRIRDASRRYRIAVVSVSIVIWFGSTFVASITGVATSVEWWPVAGRLLGLAAAIAIYYAYNPPLWIRHRWGIHPVRGTVGADTDA